MLCDLGSQFHTVFLEQGLIRSIDIEGNLPAFGEEAHVDGTVNELVGDGEFILSPAAVALQKLPAVLIGPGKPHHISLPVQFHQNLRVDGQINGGIRIHIILIIAEAEKQESTGCHGCGRADPAFSGKDGEAGLPFLHQKRSFYRLTDFISEICRFPETSLFIQ